MIGIINKNLTIFNVDGSQSFLDEGDEVEILYEYIEEDGNPYVLIRNEYCLGIIIPSDHIKWVVH